MIQSYVLVHRYANFFLHPVREEDAPGYKDIILRSVSVCEVEELFC